MPIAILGHGLGPILLAVSAPQPVAEQSIAIAAPEGRFDLARVSYRAGLGPGFARPVRRSVRFPAELPSVQAEEVAPPAFVWSPSASSILRIDPTKVRYRLLF